ncbi:5-oxoprolinase subunit B family protein [Klenkia taihuensis]|uniref:Sensor histidine kinase inhibitor, KipI family n=1 Tax=Klenkia taihuensis TaxID=1225127 RepID=A0A1I1UTB7_9ACTN|nr:allophanate hydrolase subunit 1 [Klenkia taihuensis]GHE13876.1 allophanate hydrolase [Klenkia taihuensis]SFD73919.1 sensor histidine kinase inhibitor, KipI family [Klenkia taihuensis]
MRLLPSGDAGVLVELADLDEVLALHAALADPPAGVLDVVPAARTVLVVLDPGRTTTAAVASWVRAARPVAGARPRGPEVEVPVHYDGADLADVAAALGCSPAQVVARHTGTVWTVAFGGFAPGFGYAVPDGGGWDVPRRSTPRTRVPAGAVAVAGGFGAVYPQASPGGWQLLGRTDLAVFDVARDPAALLRPGVRIRFTEAR